MNNGIVLQPAVDQKGQQLDQQYMYNASPSGNYGFNVAPTSGPCGHRAHCYHPRRGHCFMQPHRPAIVRPGHPHHHRPYNVVVVPSIPPTGGPVVYTGGRSRAATVMIATIIAVCVLMSLVFVLVFFFS